MVVLSNGMYKSGSSLLRHHTVALLALRYSQGGQRRFKQLVESGHFQGRGAFLAYFDARILEELCSLANAEGPIVVKVHCRHDQTLAEMLRSGTARATFTHRDPRDVLLSARDHHRVSASQGRPVFDAFGDLESGLAEVARISRVAIPWIRDPCIHVVAYRDLVAQPEQELTRLTSYLGMNVSPQEIARIVHDEATQRRVGRNQFNKGQLTRFRTEMSAGELARSTAFLTQEIRELGYES